MPENSRLSFRWVHFLRVDLLYSLTHPSIQELQTQQGRQQELARRIEDLDEDVENYRLRENLQRKIEEEECMKLVRDFRIKTNERTKLKRAWRRYQKRYQDHVDKATPCMKVRESVVTTYLIPGLFDCLLNARFPCVQARSRHEKQIARSL